MKPIPAIVEKAFDADVVAEHVIVALADLKNIEGKIKRVQGQLDDALGAARMRRIELGRWLTKARAAWPERGPNAKGWGQFLERVKIPESTARMYMDEFRDPTGFAEKRGRSAKTEPDPEPIGDRDTKPANVNGGSGDPLRGSYCTPAKYAAAVGVWDLDPFSNPRSHIVARESCQLERGDNGLLEPGNPGAYLLAGADQRVEPFDIASDDAIVAAANRGRRRATESTRVWIQPPYEIVEEAIAHYGHTRFCALLRFDPSTDWFAALWVLTHVIAIPVGERLEFEAPPGIETSANPYPHAFYYADERDVTPAIRELCIVLRVEHPKGGDASPDEPA